MRPQEEEIAAPWPQQSGEMNRTDPSPQRGRSRHRDADGHSETVTPDDDAKSEYSNSWGQWREEKEDEPDEAAHRTGNSRRPRRTNKLPGEKRRGKPQVATYKAGLKLAIALIAVDLAECHSFVQVCDQGEMRLAYLIIFILLCLLFFACAYICKLYCAKKVSLPEISTVQTEPRPVVMHSKGKGKSMSVVHSSHLPAWCKDIYMCNSFQLERNPSGGIVHTKRKYHVQQDCPSLRDSHVMQISLCKICANKHK